ncbi:R8 protein [Tieghemiomyces parasiticus]|uniref:R8 protein n=1 Tax=Tieghemiomyces parasiticus TaxID=78921 RepID=A0A9W8DLQ7_9FUNG|nr:R8 protein [Tieghemiomyces parasiticus]
MFYVPEIAAMEKHGMALIWLAATFGTRSHMRRLTRKEISHVDVQRVCRYLACPPQPLALRLLSSLVVGISRIYQQQVGYYSVDVNNVWGDLRRQITLDYGPLATDMVCDTARLDTITLPLDYYATISEEPILLSPDDDMTRKPGDTVARPEQPDYEAAAGTMHGHLFADPALDQSTVNKLDMRHNLVSDVPLVKEKRKRRLFDDHTELPMDGLYQDDAEYLIDMELLALKRLCKVARQKAHSQAEALGCRFMFKAADGAEASPYSMAEETNVEVLRLDADPEEARAEAIPDSEMENSMARPLPPWSVSTSRTLGISSHNDRSSLADPAFQFERIHGGPHSTLQTPTGLRSRLSLASVPRLTFSEGRPGRLGEVPTWELAIPEEDSHVSSHALGLNTTPSVPTEDSSLADELDRDRANFLGYLIGIQQTTLETHCTFSEVIPPNLGRATACQAFYNVLGKSSGE